MEPIKLNATFLKKCDKLIRVESENRVDGFELFFILLNNITKVNMKNPIQIFNSMVDFDQVDDPRYSIAQYTNFHNSIIAIFETFREGKSSTYLKKNLIKLLPISMSKKMFTQKYFPVVMQVVTTFVEQYNLFDENLLKLVKNIDKKFDLGKEFSENIGYCFVLAEGLMDTKMRKVAYIDKLSDTQYMEELLGIVIRLAPHFIQIRQKNISPDAGIETELYELGSDKDDIYFNVGNDDPCPCGSGKKYKKCCRKSQEFPLTRLAPQTVLAKPNLTSTEVRKFYTLYDKLLTFVQNDYAKLHGEEKLQRIFVPQYNGSFLYEDYVVKDFKIVAIKEHLVNNTTLVDKFIESEGLSLEDEEKDILLGWKKLIYIHVLIIQEYSMGQVFAWDLITHTIYFVYGLYDKLSSLIPTLPFRAKILLLPFAGRIIFDGLLLGENVEIGKKMLGKIVDEYQADIIKNGIKLFI